jgi:hypothetical protein
MANKRPRTRTNTDQVEKVRAFEQLYEVLHLCNARLKGESMLPFMGRLAASSKQLQSVVSAFCAFHFLVCSWAGRASANIRFAAQHAQQHASGTVPGRQHVQLQCSKQQDITLTAHKSICNAHMQQTVANSASRLLQTRSAAPCAASCEPLSAGLLRPCRCRALCTSTLPSCCQQQLPQQLELCGAP